MAGEAEPQKQLPDLSHLYVSLPYSYKALAAESRRSHCIVFITDPMCNLYQRVLLRTMS